MEEGTPQAESESLSIDQIVDQRVSQRNAPPEAASETADPPAEAIAEAEAPEAEEVEYEAVEPDDGESQAEYEADDDEGEEVEFDLYEQTGVIKVNGEERKMTVREAFDKVQKGEAADQKFQEAAEIRKQYESRSAQLEQTENEYRQGIDAIAKQTAQQGQQQFGYKDQAYWDALREADIDQWNTEKHELRDWQDKQAVIQQEQTRMHQQQKVREEARLLERIPEWKDPAIRAAETQQLVEHAQSVGYTTQEITTSLDSRMVGLVRDSHLLKKMLAERASKKPLAAKKIKAAPKMVKSGQPKSNANSAKSRERAAYADFQKLGTQDAALKYRMALKGL
jgi:hypothetical protein